MNLAAQVLPHPLTSTAPSELYDAAQSRQAALVNLLRLLAGAPDLGAPTEEVLTAPSARWNTWRPMPSGCMPPLSNAPDRRAHNAKRYPPLPDDASLRRLKKRFISSSLILHSQPALEQKK